jgi:tellurium resistance protein TerD
MTGLIDPGLPPEDPRSMYFHNLSVRESCTWYTAEADLDTLVSYVLGLLGLTRDDFMHSREGFAMSHDEGNLLIAVTNARGVALTVWGQDSVGLDRLNKGISDEWDLAMDQMSRGEYAGNAARARWIPIVLGKVREDFEGSEGIEFINGAQVVPVDPQAHARRWSEPEPAPAPQPAEAAPEAPLGAPPVEQEAPPRASVSGGAVLAKGANASLAAAGTTWRLELEWREPEGVQVEALAIVCGAGGTSLSDAHFVFSGNPGTPDGAIHQRRDRRSGETFDVDLGRLGAEAEKIVIGASLDQADGRVHTFGGLRDASIRIVAEGPVEVVRFDLPPGTVETAMVFGEVYRRNGEWRFRAVGQGYTTGRAGLARDFGITAS